MDNYKYHGVYLNELTDEEVLFFIRIRGKKSYFNTVYSKSLTKIFSNLKNFRTISEYRKDANVYIDLNMFSYKNLSDNDKSVIKDTIDINEIIQRCRALRKIAYLDAIDLIYSCSKFFIELYKDSKLKMIISGTIDNYVMDIMIRIASYYKIKNIGITDFFLYPNYKLITSRGENNIFRNPDEIEVEKVFKMLSSGKKSPLAISKNKAIFNAIRDYLSFIYRYLFRYILKYKICNNNAYEYRFAPLFKNFYSLNQLLSKKYFDNESDLVKCQKEKLVYIPLHYYPEATIDYWTDSIEKTNYKNGLIDVIKYLKSKNHIAVIKEHPAFYLARPVHFYQDIKSFDNVILINPFVLTTEIFNNIDNVIVWNGSTGIEALMKGKKVSIVTESYYSNKRLLNFKEFEKVIPLTEIEKKDLVKYILQTTLNVD